MPKCRIDKYIFTHSLTRIVQSLIRKLLYDFDNLFRKHFVFMFIDLVRCDLAVCRTQLSLLHCNGFGIGSHTHFKCSVDVFIVFHTHKRCGGLLLPYSHPLVFYHACHSIFRFRISIPNTRVCDVCAPFIFPQIQSIAFFIYFSSFFSVAAYFFLFVSYFVACAIRPSIDFALIFVVHNFNEENM